MTQGESSLPRSVVALVRTGLSHLERVENAAQFMVSLIRGLGSNLTLLSRELFAKQVTITRMVFLIHANFSSGCSYFYIFLNVSKVFDWFGEYPLDPGFILNCHYNTERGRLETYALDSSTDVGAIGQTLPIVHTINVKLTLSILSVWLHQENSEPFLLVGPAGCGKRYILFTTTIIKFLFILFYILKLFMFLLFSLV